MKNRGGQIGPGVVISGHPGASGHRRGGKRKEGGFCAQV